MKKAVDVAARTVTFTSEDGTVSVVELDKLSPEMVVRAALHGVSQKVGDSYSGAASESDPEAFARECVRETVKQLYEGAWRAPSAGGGPRASVLVLAFAAVSGQSTEAAAEFIEALSDDEKKDLQKKPKIKVAIAKIKLERQQKALEAAEKAEAEEAAKATA